jgi:hypothetical protein
MIQRKEILMTLLRWRSIAAALIAGVVAAACADMSSPNGSLGSAARIPGSASFSGGTSSSGGSGGGSLSGGGSVPTVDVIKFGKHSYDAGSYELLVSASSSNTAAHLLLYAQSGAYLGEVQNGGGGKYGGSVFVVLIDPVSITIKSSLGGSATIATVPFQP